MNIVQALGYGGQVAAIGILIVFTGLVIIIAAISILAAVFTGINKRKAEKAAAASAAAAAAAAVAAPAPVAEPEVVEETVEDDPALIAVIAAAIAAFDNSGKALVVRKVRKVSGWNRAARTEQVTRF